MDTLWIESLNTVLDDNRLLTLASGDRIPMTANVKMLFEPENLQNASPATVSRAGIVYVSATELDYPPVLLGWIRKRPVDSQGVLTALFDRHLGAYSPDIPGAIFDFLTRQTNQVLTSARVGVIQGVCHLLTVLMDQAESTLTSLLASAKASAGSETPALLASPFGQALERLLLYSIAWGVGGLLEPEDRLRFDAYLRAKSPSTMPQVKAGAKGGEEVETIYEFFPDVTAPVAEACPWKRWSPPVWRYPQTENLDFSNLLVPTMDSTRSIALLDYLHAVGRPVLMVGGPGTAKTSTALMFFTTFDASKRLLKRINFSSATTPGIFQQNIEAELDKRGGKSFGPPGGKKMTVFVDDLSVRTVGKQMVNVSFDYPFLVLADATCQQLGRS